MTSIPPPDSRRDSNPDLHVARGAMRDTLGAIRNLERLLKNVRIEPRALGQVIPDVHAACAPLVVTTEKLLGAVGRRIGESESTEGLLAYIVPRVHRLEARLSETMRLGLSTRERLDLEVFIERSANELEAASGLVDLLEHAVNNDPVLLDFGQLIVQSRSGDLPVVTGSRSVEVTVSVPEQGGPELVVTPAVAMSVLALSIALVRPREHQAPYVAVELRDQEATVRVQRAAGIGQSGQRLKLVVPPLIEPSLACAKTAARSMSASLCVIDGGTAVELRWSATGTA